MFKIYLWGCAGTWAHPHSFEKLLQSPASLLQRHCNTFAVALQCLCSGTAKGMQYLCSVIAGVLHFCCSVAY